MATIDIETLGVYFSKIDKEEEKLRYSDSYPKMSQELKSHLFGYFLGQSIEYLVEDVLPEVEKAIAGEAFDKDGGGFLSFLTIGESICVFSGIDEAKGGCQVSTEYVKRILIVWAEWCGIDDIKRT